VGRTILDCSYLIPKVKDRRESLQTMALFVCINKDPSRGDVGDLIWDDVDQCAGVVKVLLKSLCPWDAAFSWPPEVARGRECEEDLGGGGALIVYPT
jgi:hypothetical protein